MGMETNGNQIDLKPGLATRAARADCLSSPCHVSADVKFKPLWLPGWLFQTLEIGWLLRDYLYKQGWNMKMPFRKN